VSGLNGSKRKYLYLLGQIFNIGGLVFFKYINFIFESFNSIVHSILNFQLPYLNVIVPIGISYYTFQGISYLYLINKAKDKPERNIINFGLYMIFFPKLLAGPIERHRKFLPQINRVKNIDVSDITIGARLFLWGALKKTAIADVLFVIVDTGIRSSDGVGGFRTLFVFMLLPLYMYFDFSGYTDMARGVGRMFGYRLAINFNFPLFAQSISDFWRRWHISLSSWCNDFIFVRLLVKHKRWKNWAFIYSVFATFIIVGLWHGASMNFVVLGLLQAFAITFEFLTKKQRKMFFANFNGVLLHILSSGFVYLFFGVSLTFFLFPNITASVTFLGDIFHNWNSFSLRGFDVDEVDTGFSLLLLIAVFTIELVAYVRSEGVESLLPQNSILRKTIIVFSLFMIIYFSKYQNVFVYANF
jgi:D-alanyl-lipoteichoic acid acyltransferase DltB (MBOAT superfamily)